MKIIYIASSPVPSLAANSVHVMKMSQALARCGHKVVLFTPEHNRKEPQSGIDDIFAYYGVAPVFTRKIIPFFNMRYLKYRSATLMTGVMLTLARPDLVYTRSLSAANVASFLGFKVLFERHDAFENASESDLVVFRRLIASRSFQGLVVISESLKKEIMRKFALAENRVIVAHDGADAFEATTPALRPGDKVRIGYTGHLYQGRGIDLIGQVAERLPDCEFHIVGGTDEDIALWKDRFSALSNVFFHGHVSPSQVPSYIASFDILLAPYQEKVAVYGNKGDTSRWMSPLKIFEYMSSGKPIVCSNIPVLREVLHNDENALLCTPADAIDWVDAIKELMASSEKANRIASKALSHFTGHYSWQKRAEYILNRCGL